MPTECKIDNDVSRDFTVVEVITEDRPGVLYAIARALFVAGLDIHRSKIATEANRAIDVFYVRDKATMDKITDPERQAQPARDAARAAAPAARRRSWRAAHSASGAIDDADRRLLMLALLSLAEGGGAAPLLEKGEKLFRQGDVAGALAAFDEAAKVDPKDARPHYLKGVALEKKGDNAGARPPPTSRRSRARPTSPRRTTTWARCCSAKNDLPGAAGEFEAAVKAKPAYAEAQYNLGVARDGLGKKEEAVAAYKEAVRLKPADAGYRMNLGAALRRTGDVNGALVALKEATRLAPRDATAWANLGMVLSDNKSYDEANAALDKATKLKPDFALAWNRLGRVALKRGELVPAVAAQEKARKLEPKNGAFAADLCRALIEQKQAAARGRRVPRRGRPRAEEPARPLRADEGAGREGRLRRGQGARTPASRRCRSSRRRSSRPTPSSRPARSSRPCSTARRQCPRRADAIVTKS